MTDQFVDEESKTKKLNELKRRAFYSVLLAFKAETFSSGNVNTHSLSLFICFSDISLGFVLLCCFRRGLRSLRSLWTSGVLLKKPAPLLRIAFRRILLPIDKGIHFDHKGFDFRWFNLFFLFPQGCFRSEEATDHKTTCKAELFIWAFLHNKVSNFSLDSVLLAGQETNSCCYYALLKLGQS